MAGPAGSSSERGSLHRVVRGPGPQAPSDLHDRDCTPCDRPLDLLGLLDFDRPCRRRRWTRRSRATQEEIPLPPFLNRGEGLLAGASGSFAVLYSVSPAIVGGGQGPARAWRQHPMASARGPAAARAIPRWL